MCSYSIFFCVDGFSIELSDLRIFPKYTLRIPYNKKQNNKNPANQRAFVHSLRNKLNVKIMLAREKAWFLFTMRMNHETTQWGDDHGRVHISQGHSEGKEEAGAKVLQNDDQSFGVLDKNNMI